MHKNAMNQFFILLIYSHIDIIDSFVEPFLTIYYIDVVSFCNYEIHISEFHIIDL